MMSTKPVSYSPESPRLLDQFRAVLRYKHYSLRTEEAYLYWVKFFVRWHGRNGQVRHPRELGATEVQGSVRIFVFEARGVGLIHAVVRLWLTCWPSKAKGTLST